jgi:hypothetical protein
MQLLKQPIVRVMAIAHGLIYFVGVGLLALLKIVWFESIPWAEVFYGPAITVSCCFFLFLVVFRIELWIESNQKQGLSEGKKTAP